MPRILYRKRNFLVILLKEPENRTMAYLGGLMGGIGFIGSVVYLTEFTKSQVADRLKNIDLKNRKDYTAANMLPTITDKDIALTKEILKVDYTPSKQEAAETLTNMLYAQYEMELAKKMELAAQEPLLNLQAAIDAYTNRLRVDNPIDKSTIQHISKPPIVDNPIDKDTIGNISKKTIIDRSPEYNISKKLKHLLTGENNNPPLNIKNPNKDVSNNNKEDL